MKGHQTDAYLAWLPTMDVIPVLDLLGGRVVRGVAGQRETYAPVESTLVDSAMPLAAARSIRDAFGLHRLYLADLDAIMQDAPQWSVIEELVTDGFDLIVDAGLREPTRAVRLVERGVTQVIAALETLPSLEALDEIVQAVDAARVVFSLDLMHGAPLGNLAWPTQDTSQLAELVVNCGVTSMIVLDLSGVGVGGGIPTLEFAGRLKRDLPQIQIITGGGVRDLNDIQQAATLGIDGLLIASALHNGSVSPKEMAAIPQ